jgi:hypothetical protein
MGPNVDQAQVFCSVISAIAVDVIDVFPQLKWTSQLLRHDPAVFVEAHSSNTDSLVALIVGNALGQCVAGLRAESFAPDTTRWKFEGSSALGTDLYCSCGVVSLPTPNCSQTRNLNRWDTCPAEAFPRAKPCSLSNLILWDRERLSADFACQENISQGSSWWRFGDISTCVTAIDAIASLSLDSNATNWAIQPSLWTDHD